MLGQVKYTICTVAAVLITTLCPLQSEAQSSNLSLHIVQMTHAEKVALDTFFSNFAEVDMDPFKQGTLRDPALISAGYFHVYHNAQAKMRMTNDGNLWISRDEVQKTCMRFFGTSIRVHQAVHDVQYRNGEYGAPAADGDAAPFAQINRLEDVGGGTFAADVTVYLDNSEEPIGNPHADPAIWARQHRPVNVLAHMRAHIKRVTDANKSHFILLDWIKVGAAPSANTTVVNNPESMKQHPALRQCLHQMRDAEGRQYTVFLGSNDAQVRTVHPGDKYEVSAPFDIGDGAKLSYGHYYLALIAPGQTKPVIQDVRLNSIKEPRNLLLTPVTGPDSYVVSGGHGIADLLVLTTEDSGRTVSADAYFVSQGKLRKVIFRTGQTDKTITSGEWSHSCRLTRIAPGKYWVYFCMMSDQYEHEIYHFDENTGIIRKLKEIDSNTDKLPRGAR